ncbi:MAG: hypothetical protein LAT67_04695 [Balneolales bacterium]|nr:hypothetical protein [Balneolales bacterium]
MMKTISRIPVLAVILVVFAGFNAELNAQHQSDYQIVRNYQAEYQTVLNAIKTLDSVEDADRVIGRIDRLNSDFSGNAALINRYIFPENFNTQVASLRDLANASRRHLNRVASQANEITQLNERVGDLTNQIERFNTESDSLRNALQQMTRDRNANRAVAQNLRRQLESRDEFILGLVDSLFIAYDNLSLASLSASERQEFALRADRDNVVGHIAAVVESNISFVDTHTQLSSADFLDLRANYYRFENAWSKLGNKLATVYESSEGRAEKVNEVNGMMDTWKNRLDQSVWRSLSASFENRGLQLASFNSSSAFYSALNSYLDGRINSLRDEAGSEEEKARFETFADVWHNDVKMNWQGNIIDGRVLTHENIATIDRKLSEWGVLAEPRGSNYLILAIILGLVALVMVVLYVTKSGKTAEAKK